MKTWTQEDKQMESISVWFCKILGYELCLLKSSVCDDLSADAQTDLCDEKPTYWNDILNR